MHSAYIHNIYSTPKGILCFQTYGGQVGLGNFLRTGPEVRSNRVDFGDRV
jgi:hypothetical protein